MSSVSARLIDRIRNRVFLLGPSHHAYIDGVALSSFKAYGTPLGDIPLDLKSESAASPPSLCDGGSLRVRGIC